MVTPQKVQDLSEPIESIYVSMVNELLINIGRHITAPTWTHTADWEIQKLSELGQLTEENAAIINRWIKTIPQAVRDTMTDTRAAALDRIEKELEKAAAGGYVTPPERDSTMQVLEDYAAQAIDRYNLVNTNMLDSSVDMYTRAILETAASVREAQQRQQELLARADATQTILNEAAGNVATGVETRTQAVRRAIRRVSDEGLTGFVDRAGRSWTPEAYVNMVTRTTVHNVSVESVKGRMQDYNTQVFQVSAHAGARPLCYPYQGKFYSWNNTEGYLETGDGKEIHYLPLNSTSNGEPAGLFGINCGHYPIPMIPGVSIPHAQDYVQPKDENDKAYAESQEQRTLERKIREAKRVVEMGDDSKEAKDRVREAQQEMRDFISRTGRTRRYDREAVVSTPKSSRNNQNKPQGPQVPTPAPVKYGQAVAGVSQQYQGGVIQALDSAPAEIQNAWNFASGKMYEPQFDGTPDHKAYYNDKDGKTHFLNESKAYDQNTYQEKYACYFHEYGHNIDNLLGGGGRGKWMSVMYRNGEFGKTLYRECETGIKSWLYASKGYKDDLDALAAVQNGPGGMGLGPYVRSMLRNKMSLQDYRLIRSNLMAAGDDPNKLRLYFNKHLSGDPLIEKDVRAILHDKKVGQDFCADMKQKYNLYQLSDVSDMFEKYTHEKYGIDYPFGVGHFDPTQGNYWGASGDYDSLSREAFAEMFSATATQNQSLPLVKSLFPESYKLFTEMLGGAAP